MSGRASLNSNKGYGDESTLYDSEAPGFNASMKSSKVDEMWSHSSADFEDENDLFEFMPEVENLDKSPSTSFADHTDTITRFESIRSMKCFGGKPEMVKHDNLPRNQS